MEAVGLSLTLTSSVLKLVFFSRDFISDAKQVYSKGSTDRHIDLVTVATNIQSATDSLESHLDGRPRHGDVIDHVPDHDEIALRDLARTAAEIGRQLAQNLQLLKTNRLSRWDSLRTVARGLWDKEEINALEKRLDGIRAEIQLRILIGIKNKVDNPHNAQLQGVFNTLESLCHSQQLSHESHRQISEHLTENKVLFCERQEELVDLINRVLDCLGSSPALPHLIPSSAPTPQVDRATKIRAQNRILGCLWYPGINDREESIPKAYGKTLRWVYEDPTVSDKPWDSFTDFLRGDAGTYWITGKPGCGKSTLMKFISENPKTLNSLNFWASGRELVIAPFYFFYRGAGMQKSELGMLTALLASILRQKRDLIETVFEERFSAVIAQDQCPPPTLAELRRGIHRLVGSRSNIAFFFLIDGLDEFDPEVSQTHISTLIELAQMLGGSADAKAVLASRPHAEFEEAFAQCPKLRVHELTKTDIRMYANERLEEHHRMKFLMSSYPAEARSLLDTIAESSLGVFLWVRVVTDSLLNGLTNYDELEDLKLRILELPRELQDLYGVMLFRIEPRYRRQTARILTLVHHTSDELVADLSPLSLWFAEQTDQNSALTTPIQPISDEARINRIEDMEHRLKSRCLGLVETEILGHDPQPRSGGADQHDQFGYKYAALNDHAEYSVQYPRRKIRFLHKTFSDFLNRGENWKAVVLEHQGYGYCAHEKLLLSVILTIKTYHSNFSSSVPILSLALSALHLAEKVELLSRMPVNPMLYELDRVMTQHFTEKDAAQDFKETGKVWRTDEVQLTEQPHWSTWISRRVTRGNVDPFQKTKFEEDHFHSSFLGLCVEYGLCSFVQDQVDRYGPQALRKEGLPLLGYPLCRLDNSRPVNQSTLRILLANGCDPHEVVRGKTIWDWFLWNEARGSWSHNAAISGKIAAAVRPDILASIEQMILAGANPNAPHSPDFSEEKEGDWGTLLWSFKRLKERMPTQLTPQSEEAEAALQELLDKVDSVIRLLKDRDAIEDELLYLKIPYPTGLNLPCSPEKAREALAVALYDPNASDAHLQPNYNRKRSRKKEFKGTQSKTV